MDTKKLRQKILDLAIRGKLVPQDPNDEPASVLLERIRAERERLIKEGKIKRSKKSASDTPHYENEAPFEVPESWEWVRLKDLCSFLSRGKSPKYSEERKYPVFAQKCNLFTGGISLENARFLDPETLSKWSEEYKLQDGDVLVNSTGTGTVGRTRLFHSDCLGDYPFVVPDSHVSVVRTFNEVNSIYIHALLSSDYGQTYLEDNLAGSTNQKELYIGVLEDMIIPFPPTMEQNRISKSIEQWYSIIDVLESTKQDLQATIVKAKSKILDLAIHGKLVPQDPNDEPAIELLKRVNSKFIPCDNAHYENVPTKWTLATVNDIGELLSGRDLSNDECNTENKGLPYLIGASNIEGSTFSFIRWTEKPQVISQKGDILISCKGTIGAIVKNDVGDMHIARQFMAIRPDTECITTDYLHLCLIAIIEEIKKDARGVIPGISRDDILTKVFPIPPQNEQRLIVATIQKYNVLFGSISANL